MSGYQYFITCSSDINWNPWRCSKRIKNPIPFANLVLQNFTYNTLWNLRQVAAQAAAFPGYPEAVPEIRPGWRVGDRRSQEDQPSGKADLRQKGRDPAGTRRAGDKHRNHLTRTENRQEMCCRRPGWRGDLSYLVKGGSDVQGR